jgi:hypothetical protein
MSKIRVKDFQYIRTEDLDRFDNMPLKDVITTLQGLLEMSEESYPDHTIYFKYDYDTDFTIEGRQFYTEEEYQAKEAEKEKVRQDAQNEKERKLYEELHKKFNPS